MTILRTVPGIERILVLVEDRVRRRGHLRFNLGRRPLVEGTERDSIQNLELLTKQHHITTQHWVTHFPLKVKRLGTRLERVMLLYVSLFEIGNA